MNEKRLDRAAEEAIDWMVRLRAEKPDARLLAALDAWIAGDPANADAWSRLQNRLGGPYDTLRSLDHRLPRKNVRTILLQPDTSRRDLLRTFAGLGLLGGGLWLGARSRPGQALFADLSTATGERRAFALDDGSRLTLNAESAVDLAFDDRQRLLLLRRGELVVQVAPDRARPFLVRTGQGEIMALGTRYLVRQEADATRVLVLEHSVRLSLPDGHFLDVAQGESALLHTRRIERLGAGEGYRADWLEGRLSVLDEPLSAVIDALRPYRHGLIRVAPEVRQLRVQGVYSLDDSERTLRILAETLPIRIDRYTPWLVLIGPG
ncbi:FecR domain-containing protein [Azotobacter vinelandii]